MRHGARQLRRPHVTAATADVDWSAALPEYDIQRAFVCSRARHSYFLGGVGTGKTVALCDRNILLALGSQPGLTHGLFARTGRDLRDVVLKKFWERVDLFTERTGVYPVADWRPSDNSVRWVNGAETIFRPYDRPDRYRGLNLASAGIDEAEFAQGDPCYAVFSVINTRIREGPHSTRALYVASSPNGMRGVVQQFRERIAQGIRGYEIHRATMFDNPFLFDLVDHEPVPCVDCGGEDDTCPRCDGVGLSSEYIDSQRAGMSKRQWRQEGLGEVLLPLAAVFGESYSEPLHCIEWDWDKRGRWVLIVDWGEANAYFAAVNVVNEPTRLDDGRVLEPGSWVVAAERKMEMVSRNQFRRAIMAFIERGDLGDGRRLWCGSPGLPYWIAGDQAVREEQAWLVRQYGGGKVRIRDCRSREEQSVKDGVGAVDYMLAPQVGAPRLYVSASLTRPGVRPVGMRQALQGYSYVIDQRTGRPTEVFDKDQVHCHPIDALRYGVVTSAYHPPLHGGAVLPYVRRYADAA